MWGGRGAEATNNVRMLQSHPNGGLFIEYLVAVNRAGIVVTRVLAHLLNIISSFVPIYLRDFHCLNTHPFRVLTQLVLHKHPLPYAGKTA